MKNRLKNRKRFGPKLYLNPWLSKTTPQWILVTIQAQHCALARMILTVCECLTFEYRNIQAKLGDNLRIFSFKVRLLDGAKFTQCSTLVSGEKAIKKLCVLLALYILGDTAAAT